MAMANEQIDYLERTLHEQIPLTRAMGLTVQAYTDDALTLVAPLERNFNHKSTAFGGSLYSVAVLAGWGLLFLKLRESDKKGRIVIQESRTRYLSPVDGDIVATCRLDTGFERFLRVFDRRGVARIDLVSTVASDGETAMDFQGRYVVHV